MKRGAVDGGVAFSIGDEEAEAGFSVLEEEVIDGFEVGAGGLFEEEEGLEELDEGGIVLNADGTKSLVRSYRKENRAIRNLLEE